MDPGSRSFSNCNIMFGSGIIPKRAKCVFCGKKRMINYLIAHFTHYYNTFGNNKPYTEWKCNLNNGRLSCPAQKTK